MARTCFVHNRTSCDLRAIRREGSSGEYWLLIGQRVHRTRDNMFRCVMRSRVHSCALGSAPGVASLSCVAVRTRSATGWTLLEAKYPLVEMEGFSFGEIRLNLETFVMG